MDRETGDEARARETSTGRGSDRRRLIIFFAVLVLVEGIGLSLIGRIGLLPAVLIIMSAPALGAIAARVAGPGVIWWGRPSWWILAGLLPTVVVLGALWVASQLGWVQFSPTTLRQALIVIPLPLVINLLASFGEELGWRGFLWPLLRRRYSFLIATAILTPIWLVYHVPGILAGVYGSFEGLPAFATALLGWTLFIGVVTDRSRSVWPAVLCHAAWNTYVETSFTGAVDGVATPAFVGDGLVGEFGWVPAVATLALGVGFAWWHVRSGRGARLGEASSPRPPGPRTAPRNWAP